MSGKRMKFLRRKIRQYENQLMLDFFDSLKEVGVLLRLKVCYQLVFTNFRFTDKKKVSKNGK